MTLEPVIGLEIHIQLKTKSKMFCACANVDTEVAPNTAVCPICLGHPGVLPSPNAQAFKFAVEFAQSLNFEIPALTKFDRKHYAYPDLPKGYQISQADLPLGKNGHVLFEIDGQTQRVQFERIHLEEDSAKNVKAPDGRILVDYNRAGTPLLELVTTPSIHSPKEAKLFLEELHKIARHLKVSKADMEQGHLRCDANISLRPIPEETLTAPIQPNEHGFFPKTEIKNLNSFRNVERALNYEIKRQTELWNEGKPPEKQSTRGWDERRGMTVEHRGKETSADYRYFAEPDIPTIELADEYLLQNTSDLVELPRDKTKRFQAQYNLSAAEAKQLAHDLHVANWFEAVVSELQKWITARQGAMPDMPEEEWTKINQKIIRKAAGWVTTKLFGILAEQQIAFQDLKVSPEDFAEFLTLLNEHQLNNTTALVLLQQMVKTGWDPHRIMSEQDLKQITDPRNIIGIVDRVLTENLEIVEDVKNGKVTKVQYLIGQVMKLSKGKADPDIVRDLLGNKLKIDI
ncbi:MAG: Asp-tRNA(Asn)/Glu-tRNA(Gln) amidotransferase subunit GatB [Patescibacteria group bacterium]|jgi:aspartyl-tRNA(Asn)/glutamyl-tRNA(Gln) amidotransferase subunit B